MDLLPVLRNGGALTLNKNVVEVIPRKRERIRCYYCARCGSIYTVREGTSYEHCPKCSELGKIIPKFIFNLLKWERGAMRKRKRKADDDEEEFLPGGIPRIRTKREYS